MPLHSVIAFSASVTFAANDSTFLRFSSNAFLSFFTSFSFVSPSLILTISSLNVFDVDCSSESSADRVMSFSSTMPHNLQACNAFCSALTTDLSSLNALMSRSYAFDSALISASSLTFASTSAWCSFSASSYAFCKSPTRAASSSSRGSADLISWRHTGQMSPVWSFNLRDEANLLTVSLCLSKSSLRTSILSLASWIWASIASAFVFFWSSAILRSARFLRDSSRCSLTDDSISMRSLADEIFPAKSFAASHLLRSSGRLRVATASSWVFASLSSFSKANIYVICTIII